MECKMRYEEKQKAMIYIEKIWINRKKSIKIEDIFICDAPLHPSCEHVYVHE